MRKLFLIFVLLANHLQGAEQFPIHAADGTLIGSPIAPTTIEVEDQGGKVNVPANMVYVPAGKFTFGRTEQRELPAYCIGRFEVTNAEYRAFVEDSGHRGVPRYWKDGVYPTGKANHPVLFISFDDAESYCSWIAKKTGWHVVVPSAEQWEKAARGPRSFLYPWGNDKNSQFRNGVLESRFNYNAVCAAHLLSKEAHTLTRYSSKSDRVGEECTVAEITGSRGQRFSVTSDGNVNGWIDHGTNTGFVNTDLYHDLVKQGGFTTPVGSFPQGVSHYGCHDMAGNAYEWTRSVITATNGAERGKQVNDVRGGSWYSTGRSGVSICTGEGRNRRGGYHSVGFRIAVELPTK